MPVATSPAPEPETEAQSESANTATYEEDEWYEIRAWDRSTMLMLVFGCLLVVCLLVVFAAAATQLKTTKTKHKNEAQHDVHLVRQKD
jgi:hypothetical protein